ncbi:MAG: meso-butanediol dehydrogenase/(S,S)-butanediol dehydrogenase/diacetyl reductase [Halieaceae bacterium]|jgi:meso-butanediol dehydrogenase/(S,S)-butanediol dehydrogenase/diacetyl reductase
MAKVIVITGAGVGLGRELARSFVNQGNNVALLGRTAAKVEAVAEELGDKALAVTCDVADPDSVRAAFAAIAKKHKTIDVLINNAAIFEPFKIVDASDRQIMSTVTANLAGPMLCTRSAVPMMKSGAHIINVSSESVVGQMPHLSVYQSSKAGLERFSESLYRELEPEGIRVSIVRAGGMYEEGKTWDVDMQAKIDFHQAATAIGIDLIGRPISQFSSVRQLFHTLVDLPADLQVELISLHARAAD